MVIGDKSLGALIGQSKELKTLEIVNCPKISDEGLAFLYETQAAWGKRRNVAGATLKEVTLADTTSLSAKVLLWISTSATNLEHICIENTSMDLGKAISELYNLTQLRELKLGPSPRPVDPFEFNQYLFCHAENLLTLRLVGIQGLNDDRLGELLDQLLSLQTLTLIDIPFGTSTTEAMCSNIPNIQSIEFVGSHLFGNDELRCIASVCLHLQSVTLRRLPSLTDAGFVRFVGLKMLSKVHLSKLDNCSSGIIKLLTICPVTELSFDAMPSVNCRDCFPFLRKDTRWNLIQLSLQGTSGLSLDDCAFLLNNFVGLQCLNLTGCSDLRADALRSLPHCNPFLHYHFNSDFMGFTLVNGLHQRVYRQFWKVQTQFRKHRAAWLVQQLRHRYLRRVDQLKGIRRVVWEDTKQFWITKAQAIWRGYAARKVFKRKLTAGRRIVRAGRDYLFYQAYLKSYRAKLHYRMSLKRKLFGILLKYFNHFQAKVRHAEVVLVKSAAIRLQRRYFQLLLRMREVFQELKFEYSAYAYWEVKFIRKIYRHWRSSLYHTARRRQLLAKMFMLTVPLSTWNSSKLLHHIHIADGFRRQRLKIIAWVALANDRLLKKRVEAMEPMAIDHYNRSFFKRICTLLLHTMHTYASNRVYKRKKKAYGELMFRLLSYRTGCIAWDKRTLQHRQFKEYFSRAQHHHLIYKLRFYIYHRYVPFTRNHIVYKHRFQQVQAYLRQRLIRVGYIKFKQGVIRSRIWRNMQAKANTVYRRHFYKFTFFAWNQYRIHCHNMEAFYVARYHAKLTRKMWKFFKEGIQISKEFAKMLALEIERKAASEAAYQAAIKSLRVFQARVRGFVQRKRYYEQRIQKLYSIQVLQNFFRTYLARKEYMSRVKKRDIAERVREDLENEMMKEEEIAMLYYLYHVEAATTIQRVFRGNQGRKLYFILAVDYYRKKNLDFYQANHHTRMHHQAYIRAAYLREQQRHAAATEIERIVRGKLCRLRYVKIKRHALMVKKSVIVQRWYRTRLAKLKLYALRRDKFNDLRFLEARDRRGLILRLMGAKKRKAQNVLGRMLAEIGLDPITFNHKVSFPFHTQYKR